ncbi:hypothetical protein Tco_0668633, partial [Tanacetum coccineum]
YIKDEEVEYCYCARRRFMVSNMILSGVGCTTTVARSSGEGSSAVYNEGGIPAIPDQTLFHNPKNPMSHSDQPTDTNLNQRRRVRSDVATGCDEVLQMSHCPNSELFGFAELK